MFIQIVFLLMFFYKNVNISSNDSGVIHSIRIEQKQSEEEKISYNIYDIYPLNLKCNYEELNKDKVYVEGVYESIFNKETMGIENSKYCFVVDSFNHFFSLEEISIIEDVFVLIIKDMLKNSIEKINNSSWIEKNIKKNNISKNLFFKIDNLDALILDLQIIEKFHSVEIIKEGTLKKVIRDMLLEKQLINTKKYMYPDMNKIPGSDYCILNEFIMNMFKLGCDVIIKKESENLFYKGEKKDLASISDDNILPASRFIEVLANKEDKKKDVPGFLCTWYPEGYRAVYGINSHNSLINHYYAFNKIKQDPISNEKGFYLLIQKENVPLSVCFKMNASSSDKKINIKAIEE